MSERIDITSAEAIGCLDVKCGRVHSFAIGTPGMLMGADWDVEDAHTAIYNASRITLTGPVTRGMGHGIAVCDRNGRWYALATVESEVVTVENTPANWPGRVRA